MSLSQKPMYNIQAVLEKTGITADTLRAWEKRYGVPQPQRTAGGHRLYSERDVQMVRWLLEQRARGLAISRAVNQWNALIASGQDPLSEWIERDRAGAQAALDLARQEWLAACRGFDEDQAELVLDRTFAHHEVEAVATQVILRGLRAVGGGWQRGEVTVQQEHFTSVQAMRCLHDLVAASPVPQSQATIVLACPPAELHSLPLLYLHLMLRRRGWRVVFLGADVPLEHLEDAVERVKAGLVIMGAQRLYTAVGLRDAAALLARRAVPLAYGGYIFNQLPELRAQVAGEFLGEAVENAADCIDRLMEGGAQVAQPQAEGASFSAQAFRTLRSEVEAALRKRLAAQVDPDVDLAIANSYFGNALTAALELGNIGYLAADMDWIHFLLTRPRLPFESSRAYLQAYTAGVRQVMGSTGSSIADWLESYAAGM